MRITSRSRKRATLLLWLLLLIPAITHGQGKFGVGLLFGDPTGIAWKYTINSTNAFDGAIGFSPIDRYRAHADYLWQSHPFNEQRLALHYGIGAAFVFGRTEYAVVNGRGYFFREQDPGFALRGVVGLNYKVQGSPIDLFFEVAPLVPVSPPAGMGADVGLGVRVYP